METLLPGSSSQIQPGVDDMAAKMSFFLNLKPDQAFGGSHIESGLVDSAAEEGASDCSP